MKNLSMLVWLSQLGISVAVPPLISIWLAVWAQNKYSLGAWVLWLGVALGVYCAASGLIYSLRAMEQMSREKKQEHPPVFNDHL